MRTLQLLAVESVSRDPSDLDATAQVSDELSEEDIRIQTLVHERVADQVLQMIPSTEQRTLKTSGKNCTQCQGATHA